MDATISSSLNADPSTISDVRSWPTSNNPGRCSERHTGSLLKNRDKITPRKRTRPTHTDAFNVLIKNLKEKIQYGVGPLMIVNVQFQGHFLWKKIAMETA